MIRKVTQVITTKRTMEGAGVLLQRVFGFEEVPLFDPFLLLDHFGSSDPKDYIKGFPWHPHRGIETVTYMLTGEVEHGDSIGNKGTIKSGDVQWMTAGSGIIHQEMPKPYDGLMQGFQLWVNLPKDKKMTKPRYRGLKRKDLVIVNSEESTVKIISGTFKGKKGSVTHLSIPVDYFDVTVNGKFSYKTNKKTAFVYVVEGEGNVCGTKVSDHHCALLSNKGDIEVSGNIRFLLVAGNPLKEPIAWGGPIVMNTQAELKHAFDELHKGTFIKHSKDVHPSEDFYMKG